MPKLLPKIPKPPRLADIMNNNPLHDAIVEVKNGIGELKTEVSEIASSLHVDVAQEPKTKPQEAPQKVEASPAPAPSTGVTDSETLQYQHDHITEELNLLETHLSEGCQIAAKTCDCCLKAAKRIDAYSKESIPIAARQGKDTAIYSQLSEWAQGLKPIVTKEAVDSGKYARQYPVESGNASRLRKAVESGESCSTCIQRLPEFLSKEGSRNNGD